MSKVNCSVSGCCNTIGNTKDKVPKVHFYSFPSDPASRELWAQFVGKTNRDGTKWEPTENSRLCSEHFLGGEKSVFPNSPAHNPTLLAGQQATSRDLRSLSKFSRSMQVKTVPNESVDKSSSGIDLVEECELESPSKSVEIQCNLSRQTYFKKSTSTLSKFSSTYEVELFYSSGSSKTPVLTFSASTQVTHEEEEKIITANYSPNATDSTMKTYSKSQPIISIEKSPLQSPKDNGSLTTLGVCFKGYQTIADTTSLHSLTGVEKPDFEILLVCLENFHPRSSKVEDLLLMFLMKIRHDLPFTALSGLFGWSDKAISRYFYQILDHLFVQFEAFDFVPWPSRENIKTSLPITFQTEEFQNVRCIVDCTEVQVEKPSGLRKQNTLYSFYKSTHTVKVLICVAPNGLITYISDVFGGHSSDKAITSASLDLLSKLEPGDVILADKGFPVIQSSQATGVVTLIPPRKKRNQAQFTPEQMDLTKKIASVRIHVERSIQRMKIFKVLKNRLGLHFLPHINKIFKVVAALVNMQRPIIAVQPAEADEVDALSDIEYGENEDDFVSDFDD